MASNSRRLRSLIFPALLALALCGFARAPALAGRGQAAGQDDRPPPGLFYPRTIVVVRHAEKGADDLRDPSLSAEGLQRAEALARLLGHSGVTHLFATEFKRTQQTLEPLASSSGAAIRTVSARDPAALFTVLEDLPRGSLAVVAGHTNTVPGLVARLAPDSDLVRKRAEALALAETDYDRVYVITQWAPQKGASLLELRY